MSPAPNLARDVLAEVPLFAGLAPGELERLASLAAVETLSCGERLYAEGDPPESFYVVASGRLRVTLGGALLGYVGRLEPVGEMGVVTGEPRTSDVHAVRDSVLLRIPREPFLAFLEANASTLMTATRLMLRRLRQYQRQRRASATDSHGTFAILPASPGVPIHALGETLVGRLGGWPQARLVTARHVDVALGPGAAGTPVADVEGSRTLMRWLNRLEGRHRWLIFAADRADDAWAVRCLRLADRVLVLAEASSDPVPIAAMDAFSGELLAPVELVLLRPEGDPSPRTLAWRQKSGARAHYFVHPWDEADLAALARQITGRGVGLVLGGGGARGFAHIGLVRALRDLKIPVDVAGGTSIGALIAALLACGFDPLEMTHVIRETFVSANYLNDYTLPKVSLIAGRRFLGRLRDVFGERRIEDLRRTFFCVSSNLTTGATVTHDHGPLAMWVGTSMALPGVAPPIAYRGELLCDGGVVDNLPTDVMQSLERGSIIASSVSAHGEVRAPGDPLDDPDPGALLAREIRGIRPSFREILLRTATLTSDTLIQRDAAERADVHIRMPVDGFGMFAFKRLDELVELGYEHALAELEPVRDSLIA